MGNTLMNEDVASRRSAETKDPNPSGEKVSWPAWFYGPDGASQIFDNSDEVPSGWEDHPSKVKASPAAKAAKVNKDVEDAEFEDVSDGDIMKALDEAKVEYKTDWPRDKLIAVLKANRDKKD